MTQPPKGMGAVTLTLAGIAAGFGVAACCALPILFASAGIGAAWLGGVAIVAAPYRTPLLVVGALCLIAGAALLLRYAAVRQPIPVRVKDAPVTLQARRTPRGWTVE